MHRKMSYEEMRNKGLISDGKYQELTRGIENRVDYIVGKLVKKGDRVVIKLKENYENDRFKRKYYLDTLKEIELEVTKIREGVNHMYDYNRFGEPLYKYYTKEYAEKNDIQGEKVFSIEGKVNDGKETWKVEIGVSRIESIEIGLNVKLDKTIQKAIDYCNLNTSDDDIIQKSIMKYKVLRELNMKQQEQVYDVISYALGYQR